MTTEGNRAGCKLDIFELGAELECFLANILEVFAADDTFEGSAMVKCFLFDDFKIIGESDAFEGGALLKCCQS